MDRELSLKGIIKDENRDMVPLLFFTIIVSIIMFISYGYVDLKSLTVWSLNLLDCLWDGNLYGYYSYCAENVYGLVHTYMGANYIPLIPWAIWNIPIWILQRWFGIPAVGHAWALLYAKLFFVVMLAATLFYSYKIMGILVGERGKCIKGLYLMLSFPMMMVAVYYVGQTDIVSICLFVIAVYKLMQGNRKGFYLWSALSIGAKPYILLAYISVVLLLEKNIWKILLKCLGGGIFILLFQFIYRQAPLYEESMHQGPSAKQLDFILGKVVTDCSGWSVSLFLIFLIAVYFAVYMHPWTEGDYKELIYAVTVPFLLFFAFSEFDFYRAIYLLPFLYILFIINYEKIVFNLLFEIIVNIGMIIKFYFRYMEFFSNHAVFQFIRNIYSPIGKTSWLDPVREAREGVAVIGNPVFTVVSSVVLAAFLLLAVINSPKCRWTLGNHTGLKEKQLLWIRAFIPLVLVLLSFYGK